SSSIRSTAYQSVPGLIAHSLTGGGNAGLPVFTLSPVTAHGIATAIVLALLAFPLRLARRHPNDQLLFGAGILLTLVAIPVSAVYAYSIAFIPIALLFRRMSREEHLSSDFFVLWAGAVLIMLPTPFRSTRLVDGWAALLAYPKLYGGLMLWALCL